MSDDSKRRGRRSVYLKGKGTPTQPGDEVVGGWSREALMRMDERFVHAVERAIKRGLELQRDV